jgi:hypothetical protein
MSRIASGRIPRIGKSPHYRVVNQIEKRRAKWL